MQVTCHPRPQYTFTLTQHIFIELSAFQKCKMTEANMVLPSELPQGPVGHTRAPLHIPTVTSAHSHPAFTLGLLQMYTGTHEYKHIYGVTAELGGCMHTRAPPKEVRSIQSPRVVRVPMGLCQLHPPALMQSPGRRGRASPSRGSPMVCSDVGQQAEVCTRCMPGMFRVRPV